ncbi:GFA family protein [Dechloromonas sp. HYN0024]|uniref:GFA family protein n=1 Tax=Dechloromonas sp. HYN0024 TaxID=2231055 RepID=UPI000E43161C|nr:GFA family protein [Dechloromonas sp. HYN0024]AXS80691.1 GFA family protein [Dechloromonas sp. HYN0024]
MKFEGGCYCGSVRYRAEGEPILEGQCHCRECQYITGGEPNTFIALPLGSVQYTKGNPAAFTRSDVPNAVTRRFCPTCGTAIGTEIPGGLMAVKVGTMDDPTLFTPKVAIFTVDQQAFHMIPEGVAPFERMPG